MTKDKPHDVGVRLRRFATAMVIVGLTACGGGGGGGGGSSTSSPTPGTPLMASVSLVATGPADAAPGGGTVRIALKVTNSGAGTATNVVVAPNLSDQVDRVLVTCTAAGMVVCPALLDRTFVVPSLPSGASLDFQIDVALVTGAHGPLTNGSVITASNDDSTADNSATTVITAYSADVVVAGSGPTAPVAAGGSTTYAMTVTNTGPDAARNLAIGNWLDSGQTLSSMTCAPGGGATCPVRLGATMSVPSLPVGGTLSFLISATVSPDGSGDMTDGMFASAAGDPRSGNNYASGKANAVFTPPSPGNAVQLQSDTGDFVGGGTNYAYARSNAIFAVTATANVLNVRVTGDQRWRGTFTLPAAMTQIQPGSYLNLPRIADPAIGGLEWIGQARGCDYINGNLVIDSVSYVNGQLTAISLSFDQHCENATPALHGQVRWNAVDTSATPPGPLSPLPANLWWPAAGSTPTSGSYAYLQSDPFDYIDRGATQTYTKANSAITVAVTGGLVEVHVEGDENWYGDFQAMSNLTQLQPGYYFAAIGYPFQNPARAGLDWFGEGRDCDEAGWFVVDGVSYNNSTLATLDLRFEQHCENSVPALRGMIHWDASDTTVPPGPVNPPPAGLWTPAAGTTPPTGNYIYLVTNPSDNINVSTTIVYTPQNATVVLRDMGSHLYVAVTTDAGITQGDFQGMSSISQLQPGYYANLQRYPFNNPAKGGFYWSSSGCNTITGWFVIDDISYSNGAIASVDLRFEQQRCDNRASVLHGKVHWAR